MAFSPFARYRNFTVDNLKSLLSTYPDMAAHFSWSEAGDLIEAETSGYKKTAYQQACQFGLEDRSSTATFRIQSYLYTFTDDKLKKFLEFWLKTYYAPNPYVNSDDNPIIIYCELGKEILSNSSFEVDYADFFSRRIGGKSDDILMNAIKSFAYPIEYRKDPGTDKHIFFIKPEHKPKLESEIQFIEEAFPIVDSKDKKAFFDRYSYESFCNFFGISTEIIKEVGTAIDVTEVDIKDSYTLEEFGAILKDMYDHAESDMQVCSIYVFGIKYGKVILKEGYKPSAIITAAGLNDSYYTELTKAINVYKALEKDAFGITFVQPKKSSRGVAQKTGAENVLLYGVPGAGKSHMIKTVYCNDRTKMERVVFHPDYTYSDFVGQILPKVVDGQLKYEFTPGPFTTILKKAWEDPANYYYLVVEEINRGNAPAIFGEIFQLLDRKSAGEYPDDEVGESEYGITNFDIAKAVYDDETQEVYLPANLWILATMNTADQNVFTLDTAFQRRWIMKHIDNDVLQAKHASTPIEGTTIDWGTFTSVVNGLVLEANAEVSSSEDKRLGAYFIGTRELQVDRFPEKVLKYLWDDAFKMSRDFIFTDDMKSLELVIETYQKTTADRLQSVLRADVYNKMLSNMSVKKTASTAVVAEDATDEGTGEES